MYQEAFRPQFPFTANKHWINDPNGLVYFDGEYHLYFQHTPGSMVHGRTTWGHAISTNLINWVQLHTKALYVDEMGWKWSGSAAVDHTNTGGFQIGKNPPMIAFYTAGGAKMYPTKQCVQCIAFSNDRGRSWTKYERNPILGHIIGENRDPKVIWHKGSQQWIMALFLDNNDYAIFSSQDLKTWRHLQDLTLPGVSECPDLFELPVDNDSTNTKWVFWGASGGYVIGDFNGKGFTQQTDVLQSEFGSNGYAAQPWSDIPDKDGRRIQISWMRDGQYPGMPFNQQMSFPVELTLRRTIAQEIRLFREPIRELGLLYANTYTWPAGDLAEMAIEQFNLRYASGSISPYRVTNRQEAESVLIIADEGELFDVHMELELDQGKSVEIEVQGHPLKYDGRKEQLVFSGKNARLRKIKKVIKLQLLVDRTSIEIFGNDGEVTMSFCFLPKANNYPLTMRTIDGGVRIVSLTVHRLRSAWEDS